MRRILAPLAVGIAVGAGLACPVVAGEKPEQIVHYGRPITLGPPLRGTEWFAVRDLKFRLGEFLDGKPAVVATGLLDSALSMRTPIGVYISLAGTREDCPNGLAGYEGALIGYGELRGTVEKLDKGRPAKFYAAGQVERAAIELGKVPKDFVYYVKPSDQFLLKESVVAGPKAEQVVQNGRPITLGPPLRATEWFSVRDIKFRMGKFLDGKSALVASGFLESRLAGPNTVTLAMHTYVRSESGAREGLVRLARLGAEPIKVTEAGKSVQFYAVNAPEADGSTGDLRALKPSANVFYYVRVME